jgi:hypothetical protein
MGSLSIKNSVTNISRLGTFNEPRTGFLACTVRVEMWLKLVNSYCSIIENYIYKGACANVHGCYKVYIRWFLISDIEFSKSEILIFHLFFIPVVFQSAHSQKTVNLISELYGILGGRWILFQFTEIWLIKSAIRIRHNLCISVHTRNDVLLILSTMWDDT